MRLKVIDPNNTLDRAFINWLAIEIRNTVIKDIDAIKLKHWDIYLNKELVYKNIYINQIKAIDIIAEGISNLYFQTFDRGFWISINPNILISGLDRVKLESICKLINYGNQEINGYPIFTDTFKYIADHINEYVEQYLLT